jgi:protein-S-isoprenylcysteine O-methyltransferase Ste14
VRWWLASLLLISLVIYAHAIQKTFVRSDGVRMGMRLLQILGAGAGVAHLWALFTFDLRLPATLVATMSYLAGLGVFAAARNVTAVRRLSLAYSLDMPTFLINQGIYRYIRHPFYSAYILTWLAGVIAAPGLWVIASTLVMIVLYARAALLEEQKFAASALAEDYAAYRLTAGMFLPRLPVH